MIEALQNYRESFAAGMRAPLRALPLSAGCDARCARRVFPPYMPVEKRLNSAAQWRRVSKALQNYRESFAAEVRAPLRALPLSAGYDARYARRVFPPYMPVEKRLNSAAQWRRVSKALKS